jgi:hypothetical protein
MTDNKTMTLVTSELTTAEAKDFVRLHPDTANWWLLESCFVGVPIQG